MKPKFSVEDRVTYRSRSGSVTSIINLNDPSDIRAQGYRYEVFFAKTGWTYSVLESSLKAGKRTSALSRIQDSVREENANSSVMISPQTNRSNPTPQDSNAS